MTYFLAYLAVAAISSALWWSVIEYGSGRRDYLLPQGEVLDCEWSRPCDGGTYLAGCGIDGEDLGCVYGPVEEVPR